MNRYLIWSREARKEWTDGSRRLGVAENVRILIPLVSGSLDSPVYFTEKFHLLVYFNYTSKMSIIQKINQNKET